VSERAVAAPAKKRDFLRWVIWPVLALVAAGGVFEVVAKRQAGGTARAWRDALGATAETESLRVSDLGGHVSGSPTVSETSAADATREHTPLADKTLAYTWPGLLRKYVVRVHVSRGEDPEVEAIEGP
jgi:hypothetical protein